MKKFITHLMRLLKGKLPSRSESGLTVRKGNWLGFFIVVGDGARLTGTEQLATSTNGKSIWVFL